MPAPRARLLLSIALVPLGLGAWWWWGRSRGIAVHGYEVVARYPHDPAAYTQGLLFAGGFLYESTGRTGTSSVREVALETGQVLRKSELGPDSFGEGLALVGERLIQLTWKEGKALVYERSSFARVERFEYQGEGWGLTFDGEHLIQSDGSDVLRFRDPVTFAEVRSVRVHAGKERVRQLNELEFVDGEVWANVWKKPWIARIDPDTGEIRSWIDLRGIFDASAIDDSDAVLNGVAYDAASERIFVTGKLWPTVFEIRVLD